MNYVGFFKMVSAQEGKRLMIRISRRRKYKNKNGEYDWDNPTFFVPTYNESTYNYVRNYAHDGDLVEIDFDFSTWSRENEDGSKAYYQDCIVNSFQILHSKEGNLNASESKEKVKTETAEATPSGFVEIDVDDEDIPF